MKKQKSIEIIKNYFDTLANQGNISSNETENFIDAFIRYIFELKNLKRDDYRIAIQKISISKNSVDLAKMQQDGSLFNLYLPRKSLSVSSLQECFKIFDLAVSCAHETHHIIQYIKAPKMMENYNIYLYLLDEKVKELTASKRQNKSLIKRLTQLIDLNKSISKVEKNADFRTNEYVKTMLTELKSIADNEKLIKLLNYFELLLEEKIFEEKCFYSYSKLSKKSIFKSLTKQHNQPENLIIVF